MPVTARPRLTVSAPTLTPLPYGLLSVAVEELRADEHASFGVQYEPISGVTGGAVGINASQVPTGPLTPETFPGNVVPTIFTEPFLIYTAVSAAWFGRTIGELQERATAKLALNASRWIENGLHTGPSGGPRLADPATLKLSNTPVTPAIGLGLIEDWFGDTVGAAGVIHAPRLAVPALARDRQVTGHGGQLVTVLGSPVAAGTGYPNTAPGDVPAAAGVVWLYATGPVLVNRSQTLLSSVPDGQKADLVHGSATAYATEVVSVGFEAGVVAVPISL